MSELSRPLRLYIFTMTALAGGAVLFSASAIGISPESWVAVGVIAIAIGVLDAFPIMFSERIELTVSETVQFAGMLLLPGPIPILAICLGTILGEIRHGRKWYQKLFNVAQMTLTWVVVVLVYLTFYQPSVDFFGSPQNVLAMVLAGLMYFTCNSAFVSLVLSLATGLPFSYVWSRNYPVIIWQSLSILSLGVVSAVLWLYNPLTVLLALLPVLAVRHSYELVNYLQRQTRDALVALMQVIDERDEHTFDHSERVSSYARATAELLDLRTEEIETIASAALLHDLGKVGMADGILFSPKILTPEERKSAERHAAIGAMLLSKFPLFEKGANLVRHHHERFDGKGYPDGLRGEEIPLGARIISVADSFQAMREERPYRRALPLQTAIGELKRNSGSQFDPQVVQAFLRVLQKEIEAEPMVVEPPRARVEA